MVLVLFIFEVVVLKTFLISLDYMLLDQVFVTYVMTLYFSHNFIVSQLHEHQLDHWYTPASFYLNNFHVWIVNDAEFTKKMLKLTLNLWKISTLNQLIWLAMLLNAFLFILLDQWCRWMGCYVTIVLFYLGLLLYPKCSPHLHPFSCVIMWQAIVTLAKDVGSLSIVLVLHITLFPLC